jgi:hypothetical protein
VTVAEDTNYSKLNISFRNTKITRLEEEIRCFGSVLDRIQTLMPDDIAVYDYVVQARDAIFRLQQAMQGCEVIDSTPATSGLDGIYADYQATLDDMSWNEEKQAAYDEETDETLGGEEEF